MNTAHYRGKSYQIPELSSTGDEFVGEPAEESGFPAQATILEDLNSVWNLERFQVPRLPIEVARISGEERRILREAPLPRVLDLPIKFPGSNYRLPRELGWLRPIVKRVADVEATINRRCLDEYYCYLTLDRGVVDAESCLREAPCHVDGFQGARWNPKVRINHTYTVSDVLPTTYYIQPFDFTGLDETKHDFFWEMNRQVALTNSRYAWRPAEDAITLMDAYTVHRGTESTITQSRTFLRLSYEVRIFDRLGNAHNPMFNYDWKMVPRDIEMLKLQPFDPSCDPSLRVFPHQRRDGSPIAKGEQKTRPVLRRTGATGAATWSIPPELLSVSGWVYPAELV